MLPNIPSPGGVGGANSLPGSNMRNRSLPAYPASKIYKPVASNYEQNS